MGRNDEEILKYIAMHDNACASSALGVHLQKTLNLTPDAARKAISRSVSRGLTSYLPGINLKSGSQVIYIPKKAKKMSIYNALLQSSGTYGELLRVLAACDGGLPLDLLKTRSSLTVKRRKNRIHFDDAIKALSYNGLINSYEDIYWGPFCSLDINIIDAGSVSDSLLTVESILIENLSDWFAKTNLASFGKIRKRGDVETVEFGGYSWDISAPSYVTGLREYKDNKPLPGFLVGDVWLRESVSAFSIKYFLEKVDAIISNKGNRPIIPFFAYSNLDPVALGELRSRGVMLIHIKSFFGKQYGHALLGILNAIENIQSNVVNHPTETADLFKIVMQMGGANNNLRGVLFEFIIARMTVLQGNFLVGMRHKLKGEFGDNITDIDVLSKRERVSLYAHECKSLENGKLYSDKELEDWEDRTLPKLCKWVKEFNKKTESSYELKILFCVSTDFHFDCQTRIEKIKSNLKKHEIEFLNGEQIKNVFRDNQETEMIEIYEKTLMG